jgi:hypothetical protein
MSGPGSMGLAWIVRYCKTKFDEAPGSRWRELMRMDRVADDASRESASVRDDDSPFSC